MALPFPTPFSSDAIFKVPGPGDTPAAVLDRWSNTHLSLPAAVAVPRTEEDIITLVHYAKRHRLSFLVGAGTHGSYIPVTSKTLYVDLRTFTSIQVNKEAHTVTLGGGVLTGPLIRALADEGYYSALAETDSVGVVGSLLGGGGGAFSGGQGWLIDHVVSLRLINANGEVLTLTRDSTGQHAALWGSLCGAGHGLGVVTELTMEVHSVAALGLTDNCVWLRRMIFPARAISTAVRIFKRLQPLAWPAAARLIFTPAPPGTPTAGQPIVLLLVHYFGSAIEAEQKFNWLYDDDITSVCAIAQTAAVPIPSLNEGTAPLNPHGDFKRTESLLLSGVNSDAVEKAFTRYVKLCEEAPDAQLSRAVFLAMDTTAAVKNGNTEYGKRSFFEWRNRSLLAFRFGWWTKEETAEAVDRYFDESAAILTGPEEGPVGILPSNFKYPADLTEAYSEEKIKELWRVKKLWDPEGVFWRPGM